MSIDPLRRRALVYSTLAALGTMAAGFGVVAGLNAIEGEPTPSQTPSPTATTPPPPSCRPLWEIAQSANPGDLSNQLNGVTALSGGEGWAVGGSGEATLPSSVLIERWNGTAWTAEEGPAPGSEVNELRAVDAAEPNDVWAVGRTSSGFGDRPLVLRWDGSTWLEMELPSEITGVLNGVAAIEPDDVWVVGYTGDPNLSLEEALVLHWDGLVWAVVDPGRATGSGRSTLFDVEATAGDDMWAVGYLHNDPLIVHFDGEEWTRSETSVDGRTNAVAPVTPTDVWAVGTPIQRLGGTSWSEAAEVPSDGELFGVAAVGPTDVWAVGVRPAGEGTTAALVMRFDGQEWTVVDGPRVPGSDALRDVDVAEGAILAVGYRDIEAGRRTLAILGETCPPVAT